MSGGTSPESELSATATRLWASLIEGVHLRLELFALELGRSASG